MERERRALTGGVEVAGMGGAATQPVLGAGTIAGIAVMGAVAVIVNIATFMGIRLFKKTRKARRMRHELKMSVETPTENVSRRNSSDSATSAL